MHFEVSGKKLGLTGFNTFLACNRGVSHAACADEIIGVVV